MSHYYNNPSDDFDGLEDAVGMGFLGAKVSCPVYMKVQKGQCVLKTCAGNKVLNYQTGKCVTSLPVNQQILCPASASAETAARAMCAASGQQISITNCSPFEYMCGTGQQGQCAYGQTWNGYSCVQSNQGNCQYGYTWNGYSCVQSNQGNCQYGYTWNGYSCVSGTSPQVACGANATWNGSMCVPIGTVSPGVCSYGYTWNGSYCVPGYGPSQGNCAAGYTWNGYACTPGTGYNQYSPYAQYNPYGGGYMAPSSYGAPLLTPVDTGDGSAYDAIETGDGTSAEMGISVPYSGPSLSPVSDAGEAYNTDWYQTGPAALVGGSGSSGCGGQGQATQDQWGSLQVVQTVCASQQQSSGGYPSMTQVEAEANMAGLVGLGFARNLG